MEQDRLNRVLMILGLLAALSGAIAVTLQVPAFSHHLGFAGLPVPWFTRMAVQFYPSVFLVPLAVTAAWFICPRRHRGVVCFAGGVGGAVLSVGLVVFALYLPLQGASASF